MAYPDGQFDQLAYLVEDLDAAIAHRVKVYGIGPWTVFRNVPIAGTCRGQETEVTMSVALGYRGTLQVELIEVHSQTPSPYQDAAGKVLLGLHHVAWVVDDLDAAVADATARGMVTVFRAGNPATQVAYMEDPAEPTALYEFIMGEMIRPMIAAGIAESASWDGSDPVREIG